ncbi:hypothetical protein WJX72_012540 [[Myrmecia] bisecta]|uniref:Uncharacterized protein n=1 Tax=[Myrmecia] bisecta TaxID=41462 RepID=A0AAW1RAT6_9CHLO
MAKALRSRALQASTSKAQCYQVYVSGVFKVHQFSMTALIIVFLGDSSDQHPASPFDANTSAAVVLKELQKTEVLLRGRCRPSEVVYTPFWDSVGYGLPEFAGRLLNFNAVVNRNVEDASITLPDKKRDYMVHLLKRLLIGVYAMELGSDAPLTPIIDEFEIASSLGRRKVLQDWWAGGGPES